MTRENYVHEIFKELNGIEGKKEYHFHKMSGREIYETIVPNLFFGCRTCEDNDSHKYSKHKFALVAAMCMIAMEAVDVKNGSENKER